MELFQGVVQRRLLEAIQGLLNVEVVIGLQGPRSVGKSTLLRTIASVAGVEVLDLDDPVVREAAQRDPNLFVGGASPVCIDEYQHVPTILDAIKAELNRSQRPGRFLITGSTRYGALPEAAQALTGRLHLMTVRPFSQGEIAGVRENFVEAVMVDPASVVTSRRSTLDRTDYINRVTTGGLPMVLQRREQDRARWIDDYVTQTLDRDLRELAKIRQRTLMPRLLERLASQTGQILNIAAASSSVGLEARTGENYTRLLEAVFLIDRLPAWGSSVRARAGSAPKVHVVDTAIAARLLRLTPTKLAALQPSALTQFGHLMETFVVGELLKQISWSDSVSDFGHWRTFDGDEIDIILERDDGAVVAIEVKSSRRITGSDLASLRKLKDALGPRFLGGIALYTGERSYTYEESIHVAPIDQLWTPTQ
jgi:predicted AAA+ superfamily ATPase